MIDRENSDTLENALPDDGETVHDLPTYEHAPRTIEERISPFHDSGDVRVPTLQGMPSLKSQGFVAPTFAAPPAELAPAAVSPTPALPPDGPTDPSGVPAMAALQPHHSPGGPASWDESGETATDPQVRTPAPKAQAPAVPRPGDPNIEISKSLELQVARLDADGKPLAPPTETPKIRAAGKRARAAALPTEVMLPALKRKKAQEKEGSDLPLVLGLLALLLAITAIATLVVLGVMGYLG